MRKIYIGDFESSTGNKDGSTNVYLWGMSSLDKKDRFIGVNMGEFMEASQLFGVKRVYFHNLSWDMKFIIHHLLENGYRYTMERFPKEGEFSWLHDDMGKIYQADVCTHSGHKIHFGDTAMLLMSSVDKLGKILGKEKLEVDYHKYKHFDKIEEVPEELVQYLWRDIDIVVDVYNDFIKSYKGHSISLAGTAMKDFKKHYGMAAFCRDFGGSYNSAKGLVHYDVLTREIWVDMKQGYKGGLTIGNPKLRAVDIRNIKGYSYDINSMYPAIMMKMMLPYGSPLTHKPLGNYIRFLKIHIFQTHKTDKDMPAHLHRQGAGLNSKIKYLDECTDQTYIYMEQELDELKKTYQLREGIDYVVIKNYYFTAKHIFSTWVDEKSQLKINAPTEIERLYHKIIQNSLYGKFGEHYSKGKRVLEFDPMNELSGTRYGEWDQWVERNVVEESEAISYIPIAMAVTAFARVQLIQAIRLNKHQFIYADTDSMYLTGEAVGITIHESEYGAWKPELRYTRFKWIKPKAYLAQLTHEYKNGEWKETTKIKRALAGLTKECHDKVSFENFNVGTVIKGGKRQKKNVRGGLILIDVDYTL